MPYGKGTYGSKVGRPKKTKPVKKEKINVEEIMKGLYANIHAKRKRIAAGSKERMRKKGAKGAPTAKAFRESKKTAKSLLSKVQITGIVFLVSTWNKGLCYAYTIKSH